MKITLLHNPFDLTRDQQLLDVTGTVGETLEREGLDERYVVSCNGELLPPERALSYAPREGDDVHVVRQLGNSTLRTIALIGATILAAAVTAGVGSALGPLVAAGAMSSGAAAALAAGAGALTALGASLAVNGISSLFQATPGGASYGVLGPSTTARSGIPIPKGYGSFRAAGNIVESWVDIQGENEDLHDVDEGADKIGRQYINCRVDFGFGPAAALNNLQLNDKDIESYADVAYCILLGTNEQAPVTTNDSRWVVLNRTTQGTTTNTEPTTGFDTVNNNYPQNQRIRAGIARNFVVVAGGRSDTQKLTVTVNFLRGCWRTDDSGVQKRLTIYYNVLYRPAGPGDAGWVLAQHHEYTNIQTTILRQATIVDGLAPGRYDVMVVKLGSGAYNNPMDAFEHESNKFGDELWLESVQETSYTTLSYPNSIQVCLRFMATGQLSGSDVNLTADIDFLPRATLPDELADLGMDNPAVAAYDILKDDVIGMNLPEDRIDVDFLRSMADLSDTLVDDGDGGTQKLARFCGIFDQPNTSCWKALQSVCTVGRGNPQRIGTRVTGWMDAPDIPVQMFNLGNTLLDSYEKTWLNLEDRAQEVAVTFADRADNYKTRNPVRVVTAASETSEEELKKSTVSLLGCDDRVQAYYWAVLQLHHNQDALRTHKWMSNRQAIRSRTGNVVLLQTDNPTAAWGGHVEPGSTASVLLLDRADLPFDSGSGYSVVVQLPAVKRLTAVVGSVAGSVLALAGYDGSTVVNRVVLGQLDTGILSIAPGGSGQYLFTVDDTSGFTPGAAVELWMTDPLIASAITDVQQVINEQTGHAVSHVTLTTPLPALPQEWCSYVYQSTARQAIKVRLTGVTKRIGEQRYTLTAKDYADSTYTLPPPVSGESYVPPPTSGYSAGSPANAADAYFQVMYEEGSQDVTHTTPGGYSYSEPTPYYTVTGIGIANGGRNYTAGHSTLALSSGYDSIDPSSGAQTKDVDEPLTFTVDANGGILTATGFSSKMWNAVPGVVAIR